jgi:hypothetical protein
MLLVLAIFYCTIFETSLYVASYDSHGHDGGIRTRLHRGVLPSAGRSRRHLVESSSFTVSDAAMVSVFVSAEIELVLSPLPLEYAFLL